MPDPVKTPVSMPLSTPEPMNAEMPATIRKRLIVEGNVQDVGYRALIRRKARRLRLLGFSRNLPDETVEIICEGEAGALADFMKSIDVKGNPADSFSLHVSSIIEAPPAQEGKLTEFYTDYGRKLTEIERQKFDREEIMVLRAGTLNDNVGIVGKNVLEVGQKVDGVGKAIEVVGQKVDDVGKEVQSVGSAVRNMHSDMNTRFDHMARHYDMIAMSLKEAIDHMDRNAEKTDKAIEKSRKETILSVQKSEERMAREQVKSRQQTIMEVRKIEERTAKMLKESRREADASNRELAKAVNFMIKKLSGKPPSPRRGKTRK